MSIDEAYLDVTNNKLGIHSAVKIARLIQHDIWNELLNRFCWSFPTISFYKNLDDYQASGTDRHLRAGSSFESAGRS